jgi:hypothetical protein
MDVKNRDFQTTCRWVVLENLRCFFLSLRRVCTYFFSERRIGRPEKAWVEVYLCVPTPYAEAIIGCLGRSPPFPLGTR